MRAARRKFGMARFGATKAASFWNFTFMTPLNTLALVVETDERTMPMSFPVRRMINAGFVGRNRQAVDAHIEEMRREGIPPTSSVPVLYPLAADNVTTAEQIEVLGSDTSGEVEYVLLVQSPDEIYVGVGSDHTDRALERQSIEKSKQICKNVVSRQVWRYRDVQRDWDELILQSWVQSAGGEEVAYQKAALGSILPLLTCVHYRGNVQQWQSHNPK